MRNGKRLAGLAAPLLVVLGLAACGGDSGGSGEESAAGTPEAQSPAEQPSAPAPAAPAGGAAAGGASAELVQQGQQIFNGSGNCFACHSQNGTGGQLAPSLTDNEWLWITPGPDMHTQLVTLIKTGVSKPKQYPAPMPPMGGAQLSEEQLNAVATYVHSLSPGQGG